jgi:uncharacterized protein (DUF1697 family)
MPRLVAFLRAINVGGHTVRMAELKSLIEGLGFKDVETFIASGNVLFSARAGDLRAVERRIASGLQAALGYEVATFVRTGAEVAAIAGYAPFKPALLKQAVAFNVGLLESAPSPEACRALAALQTGVDEFHVHGREAYWLSRGRQSESPFFKIGFERVLKVRTTVRALTTIRALVAKHDLTESRPLSRRAARP